MTPEDVKERLVEAAQIERRMPASEEEVMERFIHAADVARRLPAQGTRPAGHGGYVLPYVHTFAEMVGWGEQRQREHVNEIMSRWMNGLSVEDITRHDECAAWISRYVARDEDRAALWNWALSKVGGRPFSQWCKMTKPNGKRGFDERTGRNRKASAVRMILRGLANDGLLLEPHAQNEASGQVRTDVEKYATEEEKVEAQPETFWRDFDPSELVEDLKQRDFGWAERQNEIRRGKRTCSDRADANTTSQ